MAFAGTASAAPYARLVAPEDRAEIAAGTLAAIEWAPEAGLTALEHVEEWEAFLSVDGGKTYPLRVTPHLDAHIRRFVFRVPYLPTREARLLLRFGDERREVEQETARRFAITAEPGSRPPLEPFTPKTSLSRGERARRDSGTGVLIWVEGSRDGRALRTVSAVDLVDSLRGIEPAGPLLLAAFWPVPAGAGLTPPAASDRLFSPGVRKTHGGEPPSSPPPFDVRRLIHRLNE
jgi:hypothetical protein